MNSLDSAAPSIMRREQVGTAPLSFSQSALWFVEQFNATEAAYNVPLVYRATGYLDVGALERALAEMVRRHESLRTHFDFIGGEPAQVVDTQAFELVVHDLRVTPTEQRDAEAYRMAQNEVQRSFDLKNGPLFRGLLLQLDVDDHMLVLTMHHIVTDAWSLRVLFREPHALYTAFRAGQGSPLAPLAIQYSDYAVWQRAWMQGDLLAEQLTHWKRTLSGAPTTFNIRVDQPRPQMQSFKGSTYDIPLPRRTLMDVLALCRRQGITLQTLLIAAFHVLLSRWSGQNEILIAVPVFGRPAPQTHELIGYFVNTIALRLRAEQEQTFEEFLAHVRNVTAASYAHQHLPFSTLIADLKLKRDASRNPLCQVMVSLRNAYEEMATLPGLRLKWLGDWTVGSRFDLTLSILDTCRGVQARIEYRTDLFYPETITHNFSALGRVLTCILENPKQDIARMRDQLTAS